MKYTTLMLTFCFLLNGSIVQAQTNNTLTPIDNQNNDNQPVLIPEGNANTKPFNAPANGTPMQIHQNPQPQTIDPRMQNVTFTFNNVAEYGDCLDALLLAYEGRMPELALALQSQGNSACAEQIFNVFGTDINRDILLQLIELANFRATSLLDKKIFPSYGLRRRIAIYLGYLYELDYNDPQMLQYANSPR